jgi:hypothetical protein
MKTLLLIALSFASLANALAQGTVNFANGAAGVNAPVTNGGSGQLCSPANGTYFAMLYVGAAGSYATALTTNGVGGGPVQIGTASPGYYFGGTRTIATFPPGSLVTMQVRMWVGPIGSTFESVGGSVDSLSGPNFAFTPLINVTLGGSGIPNPNLVGLNGTVLGVPEPSAVLTLALGFIAFVALRCGRRRFQG